MSCIQVLTAIVFHLHLCLAADEKKGNNTLYIALGILLVILVVVFCGSALIYYLCCGKPKSKATKPEKGTESVQFSTQRTGSVETGREAAPNSGSRDPARKYSETVLFSPEEAKAFMAKDAAQKAKTGKK